MTLLGVTLLEKKIEKMAPKEVNKPSVAKHRQTTLTERKRTEHPSPALTTPDPIPHNPAKASRSYAESLLADGVDLGIGAPAIPPHSVGQDTSTEGLTNIDETDNPDGYYASLAHKSDDAPTSPLGAQPEKDAWNPELDAEDLVLANRVVAADADVSAEAASSQMQVTLVPPIEWREKNQGRKKRPDPTTAGFRDALLCHLAAAAEMTSVDTIILDVVRQLKGIGACPPTMIFNLAVNKIEHLNAIKL